MKTIYLASGLLVAGLIGSVYNPGGTATGGPPAAQQKTKAILKKLTQGPVYESLSELCSAVEKDGHCTVFPRYSPLTAVIAFVPDPYLTRLRLQFDRSIEAITWGAQDALFSFRSQWIPWQVAEPAFATLRDQEQSEEEQKQLRQQPGLLVFSGAPTNLAVFLVGESPTNGFDTVQFQAALQRVQQLNAPDSRALFLGHIRPASQRHHWVSGKLPARILHRQRHHQSHGSRRILQQSHPIRLQERVVLPVSLLSRFAAPRPLEGVPQRAREFTEPDRGSIRRRNRFWRGWHSASWPRASSLPLSAWHRLPSQRVSNGPRHGRAFHTGSHRATPFSPIEPPDPRNWP